MIMNPIKGLTTQAVEFIDNSSAGTKQVFDEAAQATNQLLKYKTRINDVSYNSKYYTKLGATIPAVSFVKFSFLDDSYSTLSLPPKYVQNFQCERVSNNVGKFSIDILIPINTFEPQTDAINVQLLSIFGLLNNNSSTITNGSATTAAPCKLEYGWRNSNANAVYKFDNSGVYGMTLNYTGNYYKYTISGLTNSVRDEAHGIKTSTTLPLSAFDNLDFSSSSARAKLDNLINENYDSSANNLLNETKIKIIIPANTPIYRTDIISNEAAVRNNLAGFSDMSEFFEVTYKTDKRTSEEQTFILPDDTTVSWVQNNEYLQYKTYTVCAVTAKKDGIDVIETFSDNAKGNIYYINASDYDDYAKVGLNWFEEFLYDFIDDYNTITEMPTYQIKESYSRADIRIEYESNEVSLDNYIYDTSVLDFSMIPAGFKVSHLVELLAYYIFGNKFNIIVDHTDKEYLEAQPLPTLSSSAALPYNISSTVEGTAKNETKISWYTYLLNLTAQCQDVSEQDIYNSYSAYDLNNDGIISQEDLGSAQTQYTTYTNKLQAYNKAQLLASKWQRLGFPFYRNLDAWEVQLLSESKTYGPDAVAFLYIGSLEDNTYDSRRNELMSAKVSSTPSVNPSTDFVEDFVDNILPDLNTGTGDLIVNPRTSPYVPGASRTNLNSALTAYVADLQFFWNNKEEPKTDFTEESLAELSSLLTNNDIISSYSIKQYYLYYIEKYLGRPTIYIGPGKDPDFSYTYTVGNTQQDSNVLDFSISEDLVYLIAAAKSYTATNDGIPVINPTTGSIDIQCISTHSSDKGKSEIYATYLVNAIMDKIATGQVKAKLQVLTDTNALKLSVTDHITVKCTNNGAINMFTGQYKILGITDNIDASGKLTTTFDLQFTKLLALQQLNNQMQQHFETILSKNTN